MWCLNQRLWVQHVSYKDKEPTQPACGAALAFASPSALFPSSSSPWALIRDPSSHSGTTLRLFQLLPLPFWREFLNWQLEHDPKRRTDAIRQKTEKRKLRRGRAFLWTWFSRVTKDERKNKTWQSPQPTVRPRPWLCISVCISVCMSVCVFPTTLQTMRATRWVTQLCLCGIDWQRQRQRQVHVELCAYSQHMLTL